jgi:hypothetical protein
MRAADVRLTLSHPDGPQLLLRGADGAAAQFLVAFGGGELKLGRPRRTKPPVGAGGGGLGVVVVWAPLWRAASACVMIGDVRLRLSKLSVNLPFGLGGVEIELSEAQVRAAWELYVEFSTRVSAHPLEPGAGSVREALDSLYSLFASTRDVLRRAGPEVAKGRTALGPLAIGVLNDGLRPFLLRWHSELRATGETSRTGELPDGRRQDFDRELLELRRGLEQYVDALATISGARR